MSKIAIIGSGISGLATAYVLADRGFNLTIYAKNFPPDTTSDKAAAFWFPYHVRNDKRGIQWCRVSYLKYITLSADKFAGISMHPLMKMVKAGNKHAESSWMDLMPENSYRIIDPSELKPGYTSGFLSNVPLIETQIFLPWMMNFLKSRGVNFIHQEVKEVGELTGIFDWVVNCTGLGARELCNDKSVYPVKGQVAIVAPQEGMPIFLDNEQPMYIVPRKDVTIIGGTYEEHVYDMNTDPGTIYRLYRQAVELFPQLGHSPVTGNWAGLRPFRSEVRLEKESNNNVIHNYGHAGSGFTLAWGCAEEVSALIT